MGYTPAILAKSAQQIEKKEDDLHGSAKGRRKRRKSEKEGCTSPIILASVSNRLNTMSLGEILRGRFVQSVRN